MGGTVGLKIDGLDSLKTELNEVIGLMDELIKKSEKVSEIQLVRTDLNKEVMNVKEAMAYLGISRNYLMEEVNSGRIRHSRNGVNYLFRKEWLIDWVENGGRANYERESNGKVVRF